MAAKLGELYAEVEALAQRAGFADYPRPQDRGQDDRVWLADAGFGRFDKMYSERGQVSLVARGDYDTILFEVFRSLAQTRACDIEVRQRRSGEDSRRQWFQIQADLMATLKPEWAERIKKSQAATLAQYPFADNQ